MSSGGVSSGGLSSGGLSSGGLSSGILSSGGLLSDGFPGGCMVVLSVCDCSVLPFPFFFVSDSHAGVAVVEFSFFLIFPVYISSVE